MNKMDAKNETNCEEKPNTDLTMSAKEEQEPLGSLTISDVPELKGQQLRSSARVFKKMKLDSAAMAVPEKSEKKEESKQELKKCYRPLWSSDDKTVFFEALNEYGKDFESIQLYISNKFRKKGVPEHLFVKTKDQIRHLYYRTWHKISKYLKFAEGIKKVTQELYGLINYGELRKKVGSVNEKYLIKLNKLIYKGSIILRVKGKSIRVKTPCCRALRKLNQLDDKSEEIRLPNRLTVELRPKDMTSFLKVQSTAQNPRLKTYMPLQKRLSNLIECLSKKWRSIDANLYEKVLDSSNSINSDCLPLKKEIEANKEKLNPLLRITPPPDCKIEVPSISLGEYFTRQSICFNSHENRLGISNYTSYINYNNYKIMSKGSKKGSRQRTDSVSDKSEKSPHKTISQNEEDICDTLADNETSNEASKETGKETGKGVKVEVAVKIEPEEIHLDEVKIPEEKPVPVVDNTAELEKQERINAIRKGWTEKDSESITLGEIYLMFGLNSKLTLEYSWDPPNVPPLETELNRDDIKTETESDVAKLSPQSLSKNLNLSESLLKLLSVAKLHYRKNIIKCPCGHVCGAKNNAQIKRDVEYKIRKILTDIDKGEDAEEKIASDEHNIYENGNTFVRPQVYIQPKIPISPYFQHDAMHLASQIDSIQRMTPRYCNRRGRRPRSKQVVVERKLPLLPNNVESGHQIVRMNIISKEDSNIVPIPIEPKTIIATTTNLFIPQVQEPFAAAAASSSNFIVKPEENYIIKPEENYFIKPEDVLAETLKQSDVDLEPSSPSRILTGAENWINSEVGDYSLSSLLGHLESPMKATAGANILNDDSRMSQDVDAQLHSMLTQNSVDFSASFADLAAEVTRDTTCELG